MHRSSIELWFDVIVECTWIHDAIIILVGNRLTRADLVSSSKSYAAMNVRNDEKRACATLQSNSVGRYKRAHRRVDVVIECT